MARNPWVVPDGFDADSKKAIKTLLAGLKKSGQTIPEAAFTQLRLGDVEGFLSFLDWDSIRGSFGDLESILASAASKSGVKTFTAGGVDATLLFDLIDDRAVTYAQQRVGKLIVEITDQMRETVRNVIAQAEQGVITYQGAAIRLQSTIPLTTRDAAAVDKFIEKQFARFMNSGLSEAKARIKAQNMGANYASKLLRSRTRTIARTEIMDSAMSGRYLGWEAGVSAGLIASDSIKEWIAEPDACPICSALDGTLIDWNSEWDFPEGVIAGSSNKMPPAHPNCRCSVVILPPDYSEDFFTPSSGGKMQKHLLGQHDQKTHGRTKTKKFDTSNYDKMAAMSSGEVIESLSALKMYDGTSLDPRVITGSQLKLEIRSSPLDERFASKGAFEALDKQANELMKNNPVSVMTEESVLQNILDEGKVKSIYDLPEGVKGRQYLEYRTAYENHAFGYDNNTPIEIRPISGITYPSEINDQLIDNFGTNYGSVQLVLKDDVKSRTTFTIGDSLDRWQEPTPIGGKLPRTMDLLNKAEKASVFELNNNNFLQGRGFWDSSYVETQVHGGIKLADIDKIVFHYPEWIDMESTVNRLNDMGISWEVVDG